MQERSGFADSTGREVHLGHVWADPDNRSDKEETDHWLEYDPDTNTFKVLIHTEYVSGPNVSVDRKRIELDEYRRLHPSRIEEIEQLIAKARAEEKIS